MARKVVGDVAVRVGADVGPLKLGLADGARSVNRFEKSGGRSARRLASAVKGIGIAAVAMGAAVAAGAGRAISALDTIGKKSAQIGITAEALQELSFAAKSAGVNNASLLSSLERFSKRLGEAEQGFGAAKKQLEFLGLEAKELTSIPLDSALEIIAERMKGIEDPTTRAAVAAGFFGREGVAMVNMLKQGGAELRATRRDAREMGAVLSNELVKGAEDAEDELGRLTDVIKAQLNEALVEGAPLLIGVATGIAEIAKFASDAVGIVQTLTSSLVDLFTQTEAEAAAMIARSEAKYGRRPGASDRGQSSGVDGGGLLDSATDFLSGLGTGEGATGPRAREAAEAAEAEAQAALEAQQKAEADRLAAQAEAYVTQLETKKTQAVEEAAEVARIKAEAAEAEAARIAEEIAEQEEIRGSGRSAEEEAERAHQEKMARIKEQYADMMRQGERTFYSDMNSLMGSENEKLFKIGQAFALGRAVVDGYEAATSAWKWGMAAGGPGLAAAATAASIAKTAGLIASIKSAGSKGTSGGGGSTGGGGDPTGGGGGGGGGDGGGGALGPKVSLTLIGDQGFSRAQIVQIAEAINDSGDEGQKIDIRGRR